MILTLHTLLVVFHLFGVVLGVGGATVADYLILRRAIFTPISAGLIQIVSFISQVVTCGLVVLWISGTALFFEIWQSTPDYPTNQKLWAKVAIVLVLTLNAFVIHGAILPRLRRQVGRTLFCGIGLGGQLAFVASSAVSGVSWYVPLLLGPARELSYVVSFASIMMVYAWLLNAAIFAISCIAIWATGPDARRLARPGDAVMDDELDSGRTAADQRRMQSSPGLRRAGAERHDQLNAA